MRKVFVRCPLCKEQLYGEECALATTRKVVDDEIRVYCCETLMQKVKLE